MAQVTLPLTPAPTPNPSPTPTLTPTPALTPTPTLTMMAQDPESLEEMLVALERPLRVLGGLSATPVPDQVKDLRRAGRFAPPHLPDKSGLTLTLTVTVTLTPTLTPNP